MTSVDKLAEAVAGAMPRLDVEEGQIATAVYSLLAGGQPVTLEAVAAAAGSPVASVKASLDQWPGVYRDSEGRVVGFWGLAIAPLEPEYRLHIDGSTAYAWCALDTLFIPALLEQSVRVEATDPVTGEPVTLVVDGDRVSDLRPEGAVVSMVVPEESFGYDVIESFCHRVLFFASRAAGERWTAEHEGTMLLTVADAFALGRSVSQRMAPVPSGSSARRSVDGD